MNFDQTKIVIYCIPIVILITKKRPPMFGSLIILSTFIMFFQTTSLLYFSGKSSNTLHLTSSPLNEIITSILFP